MPKIVQYNLPPGGTVVDVAPSNATALDIESAGADYITVDTTGPGSVIIGKTLTLEAGSTHTGDLTVQDADVVMARNTADPLADAVSFRKSRHATDGSHTIVNDNDLLGTVAFQGSNGVAFVAGASIVARVDGTPSTGTNDMPTELVFSTQPDGSGAIAERMSIKPRGATHITGLGGTTGGNPNENEDVVLYVENSTAGTAGASVIEINSDGNNSGLWFSESDTLKGYVGTIGGHLYVNTNSAAGDLIFRGNSTELMRIDSGLGKTTITGSTVVKGNDSFVLTGSINVTGTNTDVPGTGTKYLTELSIGDDILVTGETRTIATIASDTVATVTEAWGSDLGNDASPECNPAAFAVIRDTGALGFLVNDSGGVCVGVNDSLLGTTAQQLTVGHPDGSSKTRMHLRGTSSGALLTINCGASAQSAEIDFRDGEGGARWVMGKQGSTKLFRIVGATGASGSGTAITGQYETGFWSVTPDGTGPVAAHAWHVQDGEVGIVTNSADAVAQSLVFTKSRSATDGTAAIVSDNDVLGAIEFKGADASGTAASDWATGAKIFARVNGTPGAGDMPTELVFATTPDDAEVAAEAFILDQAGTAWAMKGKLNFILSSDTTASSPRFQIHGQGSTTTLATKVAAKINFQTNSTQRMSISETGPVAVGSLASIGGSEFEVNNGTQYIKFDVQGNTSYINLLGNSNALPQTLNIGSGGSGRNAFVASKYGASQIQYTLGSTDTWDDNQTNATRSAYLADTNSDLILDYGIGNVGIITLVADVDKIKFYNVPQVSSAMSFTLRIKQHASSAKTVSYSTVEFYTDAGSTAVSSTKTLTWSGGAAHVMSTGVDDYDIVQFTAISDTVNTIGIYGSVIGQNFS